MILISFPCNYSLDEENQRLEALVETLQSEKQKGEIMKQQIEEFKKEYHEKLRSIQKKLSIKSNHSIGVLDDVENETNKKSEYQICLQKFHQLEKAVHGLTGKCLKVIPYIFYLISLLVERRQ